MKFRHLIRYAALTILPAAALAQQPALPAPATPPMASAPGHILLELNAAADTAAGACRLTVVTNNRLGQGLRRAAWQVAIFDREGVVRSLPVLDFGALIVGKTKVALFEIPGLGCGQIGRIVVNDVAACEAEDGADLRDTCLSGLAIQARGDIDFGL